MQEICNSTSPNPSSGEAATAELDSAVEVTAQEDRCSFCQVTQSMAHRFAGDRDQAAKRMVQLQDQQNGATYRKCGDDQGELGSGIRRREQAKTEENDRKPGNHHNE